jgi:hypothetical protein
VDIESIIDEAEPPESSVTLCLKGSLVAQYEALDAQLREAMKEQAAAEGGQSLAGTDTSRTDPLVAAMTVLREQMLAYERAFTFRAMPPLTFANLRSGMPAKTEEQTAEAFTAEYHSWVCKVIAAACADPQMSPEQADRLSQRLSDAQWRKLRDGAWLVNAEAQDVPFSAAVSVLTLASAQRSRQPEPSDSPGPGSLAGNPDPAPTTNTTAAN